VRDPGLLGLRYSTTCNITWRFQVHTFTDDDNSGKASFDAFSRLKPLPIHAI
jgi:hypothetical protein